MPATQTPPVLTDHFPEILGRPGLVVICVEGGAVKWCASDANRLRLIVVDTDGPSPVGWSQSVLPIADVDPSLTALAVSIREACPIPSAVVPVTCPACGSDVWQGFELRAACFSHQGETKPRALVRWFSCVLCNRPVDDPAAIADLEVIAGAAG